MTAVSQARLWSREYWLLCLASLFFFGSLHFLTPILPLYLNQRLTDISFVGAIMGVFTVSSLLVRPWLGKWSDELPKKPFMISGLVLFCLMPFVYPLIPTGSTALNATGAATQWVTWKDWSHLVWLLIRVVHGIGFSLFLTVSSSYLIDLLPSDQRAEGLSYHSNAIKIALSIAPLVSLWLFQHHQITWVFLLAGFSAVLALVCVFLLEVNEEKIPEKNVFLPEARPLSAACAPAGKLFNCKALFPGLVMASASMVFGAVMPYVPLLCEEKHLLEPGWFYLVFSISMIFSRGVSGKWSDTIEKARFGRMTVILPGLAFTVLAVWLMAWAPTTLFLLMGGALYGLGAGTVQPSLIALMADTLEVGERGSAMATFSSLTDLGLAGGSFWVGTAGSLVGFGNVLFLIGFIPLLGWLALAIKTWAMYQRLNLLSPVGLYGHEEIL